jgi:hypothetical protein
MIDNIEIPQGQMYEFNESKNCKVKLNLLHGLFLCYFSGNYNRKNSIEHEGESYFELCGKDVGNSLFLFPRDLTSITYKLLQDLVDNNLIKIIEKNEKKYFTTTELFEGLYFSPEELENDRQFNESLEKEFAEKLEKKKKNKNIS